jgi:hypothetical protein
MPNMAARWLSLSVSGLMVTALAGCPKTVPASLKLPASGVVAPKPASLGSLAGLVRHRDGGQPIAAAVVAVVGTAKRAETGADGWFTLGDLPEGPVTLDVSGPGFERFSQEIVVRAGLQGVELVTGGAPAGNLPFIRGISGTLSNGVAKAGDGLTVHGGHFGDETAFVLIDDQAMPIRSWNDKAIELIIDPQRVAAGAATLTVQRSDGARTSLPLVIEQLPDLSGVGGGSARQASGDRSNSSGQGDSRDGGTWDIRPAAADLADPQGDVVYESNFAATPVGQAPEDWVDVRKDMTSPPSWLHPGRWLIVSQSEGLDGPVLRQAQVAPQPYFSMRRYGGNAFGSKDGALPDTYVVTATIQPGDSPYYRSPVGEPSLLVHYRDCRNYVQLVLTENNVALYEAVDGEPLKPAGWKGLHWYPVSSRVGSVHTIGAKIDGVRGTIQPMIDGDWKFPIPMASLKQPGRHYVALRTAGNALAIGNVTIDTRM